MGAVKFLTRIALRLTALSERYVPSALAIACLLTFFVFGFASLATGRSSWELVRFWGEGFWVLLEFGMQICLVMLTGSIIADSPAVQRGLDGLARLPRTPRAAVVFTALLSMALCWLHWGLGMIASAFLVRSVVRRHPRVDYRLLVAVAYFGMGAVWHAGLSGSAPLLVATPRHFLADRIGVIPLSETVFSAFNLALVLVVTAVLTGLAYILYPSDPGDAVALSEEALGRLEAERKDPRPQERFKTPWLRFVEQSYAIPLALGLAGLTFLIQDTARNGLALTLNKLNFTFLILAVLLHPSLQAFGRSAEKAAGYLHGVVVQFPLYAGMFGIIKGSGLDQILSGWFVQVAGPGTFPLVVYWYSGILNYFIPSGGSKWAIEAPYILEASRNLGIPYSKTVLAYAWGDMVTDMIQPFWCIPLLAIAKLEFRDILGYEAVVFLACTLIGSAAFLIF